MTGPEKTQKGNPHQLSIMQHCFPKACVARFCGSSGMVSIKLATKPEPFPARPDNPVFCAERAWDQRTEAGFMLNIEKRYNALAERILSLDSPMSLDKEQSGIVSEMYCLWNSRVWAKEHPIPEHPVPGVIGLDQEVTKDMHESLEKRGIYSFRSDLTFPRRFTTGIRIQMKLDDFLDRWEGSTWHVRHAGDGEFIVPDRSFTRMVLPLTPSLCFYHESELEIHHGILDTAGMNRRAIEGSVSYFFHRPVEN